MNNKQLLKQATLARINDTRLQKSAFLGGLSKLLNNPWTQEMLRRAKYMGNTLGKNKFLLGNLGGTAAGSIAGGMYGNESANSNNSGILGRLMRILGGAATGGIAGNILGSGLAKKLALPGTSWKDAMKFGLTGPMQLGKNYSTMGQQAKFLLNDLKSNLQGIHWD